MELSSQSSGPGEDLEEFLEIALQGIPLDIIEQLKAGLKKRYDKPPLDEMSRCINRSVSLGEARQMLFNPTKEDMQFYPALIAMPPSGAPDIHPQQKVQVCALAALYLVHSKNWDLVQPFIETGGLRQLAAALMHSNAYLASQAMSSLLHITDETLLFPWHEPPSAPDSAGPRQGPFALIWQTMFDVNKVLLPNLIAHYRHPPAFPGSTGMALRLLAFYLSWLRKHFTRDGRLSLSANLLALLKKWSVDKQVSDEERELAGQLYWDFSRVPSASDGDGSATDGSQQLLGGLKGNDEPEVIMVSERTDINRGPSVSNEAEQLKEEGNEAFRRGDYSAAICLYSAALDVLVPTEQLLTEGPRQASYHANRASAYMARAASGKLREGDADMTGHLAGVDHASQGAVVRHYEAAVLDCNQALALQPGGKAAAKVLLRKSHALLQLGRREGAAAAAQCGLDKCEGERRGDLQQALRAAQQLEQQVQLKPQGGAKQHSGSRAEGEASLSKEGETPKTKTTPSSLSRELQPEAYLTRPEAKAALLLAMGTLAPEVVNLQTGAPGVGEGTSSDVSIVGVSMQSHKSSGSGKPTAFDWNAMD